MDDNVIRQRDNGGDGSPDGPSERRGQVLDSRIRTCPHDECCPRPRLCRICEQEVFDPVIDLVLDKGPLRDSSGESETESDVLSEREQFYNYGPDFSPRRPERSRSYSSGNRGWSDGEGDSGTSFFPMGDLSGELPEISPDDQPTCPPTDVLFGEFSSGMEGSEFDEYNMQSDITWPAWYRED